MYNKLRFYSKYFSITSLLFFILVLELFIINTYGDLAIFNDNENAITAVFLNKIYNTPSTIFPLIYFISVQLILHLLFISSIYSFYEYILNFCKDNFINKLLDASRLKLYFIFMLYIAFSYFLILVINNHYYPNSAFAFKNYFHNQFGLSILDSKILFLFAIIYTVLSLIIGFINLIKPYVKNNFFILISLLFIVIYLTFDRVNLQYHKHFNNSNSNNSDKNPNIVLLTIDSLRFDFINKINSVKNSNYDIPNFINNSVSFNNAYTPLARSFPALYSILSGNYPIDENIRFNLVKQNNIKFNQLLPNVLKQNNYETLYATDSNQFHIINKDWGYNYLITPKQGIYEQFIPKINDLPLSNLIINSSVSNYLFPYTYSNQAAHRLYDPITYVNYIKKSISKLDKNKSIFLHLNFEAAHWPYQNRYLNPDLPFQERYKFSLNTVNWQVSEIFNFLKEYNLLNNTIVILASDHGEALSIKDDKLINKSNFIGNPKLLNYVNKHPVNYTFAEIQNKNILDIILDINTSGGHGVDVLSKAQYQTVVAIQKFIDNNQQYKTQVINNNIILNDLYNTILDLSNINLNINKTKSSMSLAPIIEPVKSTNSKYTEYQEKLNNRYLYIETGLQVPYFDIKELKNQNILHKFINTWSNYYYINDKNYLELTSDAVNKLLQTKQYAVIHNNDILAYIPAGLKQQWRIENQHNTTTRCDIPRPINDIDGKSLALLCGYYQDTPGYYIYYNGNLNKWTLYPNTNDFNNSSLVLALKEKLVEHYKSEINI